MYIKNSLNKKIDTFYEIRKSSCKSLNKLNKKSIKNNFEEKINIKFYDDSNFNLKNNYYMLSYELDKSNDKEDTTISKDSKEINNLINLETLSLSISNQISFELLINEKKTFKNLQIKNEISDKKILTKKKNIKKKKEIQLSFISKEENYEDYDEDKKYDFLTKIKPKGLRNLGGCCYMNATLQCFYHIKELTYYFLDNKKEIKRKKGILSNGYLDLVEGLSNNNTEQYYVPQKFKNSLLEIDDSFQGSEGKDSGDLIELFLYNCQLELAGESDFADISIDQREESLIYLDLFYKNSKVRSIMTDLFNFEIKSTSKCISCAIPFYNISTENSMLFSLEGIYNLFGKNKKNGEYENIILPFNHTKRRISVEECLTFYALDGALRENTFCNFCKKKTSIFTTRSFLTLPKIIIMIMSRGEREKFECDVDFEEELDLIDLYSTMKGIPREENTKYNLLAGTILYGSGGWGHTVAFSRHFDGQYYIFNDSSVRKTNFDEIKKSKIYLLFYKKAN